MSVATVRAAPTYLTAYFTVVGAAGVVSGEAAGVDAGVVSGAAAGVGVGVVSGAAAGLESGATTGVVSGAAAGTESAVLAPAVSGVFAPPGADAMVVSEVLVLLDPHATNVSELTIGRANAVNTERWIERI